MSDRLAELADYLQAKQEQIIDFWMEVCAADHALGAVSKLTRREFRNNIPGAIDGLYQVLRANCDDFSETIRAEIAKHGHHRWKQGFTLKDLIRDWGHLNRVLIKVIKQYFEETPPDDSRVEFQALDRLSAFMTEATSSSVRRYDELRRSEAVSLAQDLRLTKEQFEQFTRVRGELLREAAHDIRGGLSAVSAASQVLHASSQPNDSFEDVLDCLDQGIESALELLNMLLDLSRLEAGEEEVDVLSVDVAELFQKLAMEQEPAAAEKGLELILEGPEEFCVPTDPQKVRRITQNLVTNAIHHTTQGEIRLCWKQEPERWVLTVSDTGPGIQDFLGSPVAQEMDNQDADGDIDKLHEPFTYQGEGIGLTIVKRLCDLLDAGIHLESQLGEGSTFTIEFPLAYEEPGDAPECD